MTSANELAALAPCPFCGARKIEVYTDDGDSTAANQHTYVAQCYNCSARTDPVVGKEKAIKQWNTRATSTAGVRELQEETPLRKPESSGADRSETETALLTLEDECWDLRCVNVPTGGDDYDVGWRVIEHYQAEPRERIIGYGNSPLEAIRGALKTEEKRRHG